MKYTVKSGSQFYVIGTADTLEDALKISDAHLDHDPADDTCIRDEAGNDVDEWFCFISEIMDHDTAGALVPMTAREAETTLAEWTKDGVEIPAGLTADALQWIWNYLLSEDEKLYQQCIEENDEAEYQETIREAASFEDPVLRSLQVLLDYATSRRDDEWKAYDELRVAEKPHIGLLDAQHKSFREAQSFYDGVSMAIMTAGYALEKNTIHKI